MCLSSSGAPHPDGFLVCFLRCLIHMDCGCAYVSLQFLHKLDLISCPWVLAIILPLILSKHPQVYFFLIVFKSCKV